MANFKINDKVFIKNTLKEGTIIHRDVVVDEQNKRSKVLFFVKYGDGMDNYGWFDRKELVKRDEAVPQEPLTYRIYRLKDGYILTLVSLVDKTLTWNYGYGDAKRLRIGYAICSPFDKFDETIGIKLAKHRAKTKPFTTMTSLFKGEFNEKTVEAIMYAKYDYINNNLENFVKEDE